MCECYNFLLYLLPRTCLTSAHMSTLYIYILEGLTYIQLCTLLLFALELIKSPLGFSHIKLIYILFMYVVPFFALYLFSPLFDSFMFIYLLIPPLLPNVNSVFGVTNGKFIKFPKLICSCAYIYMCVCVYTCHLSKILLTWVATAAIGMWQRTHRIPLVYFRCFGRLRKSHRAHFGNGRYTYIYLVEASCCKQRL